MTRVDNEAVTSGWSVAADVLAELSKRDAETAKRPPADAEPQLSDLVRRTLPSLQSLLLLPIDDWRAEAVRSLDAAIERQQAALARLDAATAKYNAAVDAEAKSAATLMRFPISGLVASLYSRLDAVRMASVERRATMAFQRGWA